jgi:hypothetical protein
MSLHITSYPVQCLKSELNFQIIGRNCNASTHSDILNCQHTICFCLLSTCTKFIDFKINASIITKLLYNYMTSILQKKKKVSIFIWWHFTLITVPNTAQMCRHPAHIKVWICQWSQSSQMSFSLRGIMFDIVYDLVSVGTK